MARVVTDLVRHDGAVPGDRPSGAGRSYLLGCDASFGRYLFDTLLDAGREFDIDVDGFPEEDPW